MKGGKERGRKREREGEKVWVKGDSGEKRKEGRGLGKGGQSDELEREGV